MVGRVWFHLTDECFEKAVRNPAQYPAASARTELQTKTATPEKPRELLLIAAPCEAVQNHQVGVTGLEPVTSCMSNEPGGYDKPHKNTYVKRL